MPPALTASDLTAHLGFWLRYVSNHVSQAFAQKIAANGVTVAEWAFMRALYPDDAVAPSVLADRMGMTRGAISKLADRLIAKDMVVRKADPDDGRSQIVALAAKGRALVPKLAVLADRNDAEFFDHLSAHEQKALRRILQGIVERRGLSSIPID